MKIIYLKVLSVLIIAILSLSTFTSFNLQKEKEKPINLKVLPKNISDQQLDSIMKGFNAALGVKCNFCHTPKTNGERGLDFASDANKLKLVARDMMRMTNKINKTYFRHEDKTGIISKIGCVTCHNGQKEPKSSM